MERMDVAIFGVLVGDLNLAPEVTSAIIRR
jgi:hypothetical protein